MSSKRQPIIIGVTGGSGSGKTAVSQEIFSRLQGKSIMILQQDRYYNDQAHLTIAEREKVNYDHPLSFDTELLVQDLTKLRDFEAIEMPTYSFKEWTRLPATIHTEPKDVIIIEGIMILNDKSLRDLMDIKVYVDTDDDIRIIRRIKRDMQERGRSLDSTVDQYLETVKPMYHQFIEPTKRYADIIVPEGAENKVAIDLLTTKLRDILDKKQ